MRQTICDQCSPGPQKHRGLISLWDAVVPVVGLQDPLLPLKCCCGKPALQRLKIKSPSEVISGMDGVYLTHLNENLNNYLYLHNQF